MNIGQFLAVILSLLLIGAGFPVAAQQSAPETKRVEIRKDPVRDTYEAVVTGPEGTGRTWIVKDPNAVEVISSRVKDDTWKKVTTLGKQPWGKPGTLADIRKDKKVREYIRTMTTLNPEQQAALNKGLDEGSWTTVKAREIPIMESWWGYNWQEYKVNFDLESKFQDTEVYLYYAVETNDWFLFASYCRNLGQPFVGYLFEQKVVENVAPPRPVVPQVVEPKCTALKVVDGPATGPLVGAARRTYEAQFSNPSGLDLAVSYKLTEKATGRVMPLSSGQARIEITAAWLNPGDYVLSVDALHKGKHISTDRCTAQLAVVLPPPEPKPVQEAKAPPPPKKSKAWLWLVLAGAGAAGAAFALKGGSKGGLVKNPVPIYGGNP